MNEIELKRRLLIMEYFKKYPNVFSEMEKNFILNYCETKANERLIPEVVRELYDELGFLCDTENIYIGFIKLIDEIFSIKDKKIIEVGGGVLPRLGERIASYQDKGFITVYDPRLSVYKEQKQKLKLVRESFDKTVDVSNTDLIIGLMPCKAAEIIVDVATHNKKDFVVALCEGGSHGEEYDFYEDDEEWRNSLIKQARREVNKNAMGKLKIKYMHEYANPYPVIYNEK